MSHAASRRSNRLPSTASRALRQCSKCQVLIQPGWLELSWAIPLVGLSCELRNACESCCNLFCGVSITAFAWLSGIGVTPEEEVKSPIAARAQEANKGVSFLRPFPHFPK
ncbi:unnamed protein product [Effrenium voratum]|nr:unnamed protein product [Effrenium voratum]